VPKNLSGGVTPVTTKTVPKAGQIDTRSGEDAFAEFEKELSKRE